jgi:hypothetical protein
MALQTRRWHDPSQPQTLQMAVWLLYFNAIFGIILGGSSYYVFGIFGGFLALLGCAAAGFGIANEQRWGYGLGVAMAFLQLLALIIAAGGLLDVFKGAVLIPFLFAIALVALLLHPMSRDYQRIWFK